MNTCLGGCCFAITEDEGSTPCFIAYPNLVKKSSSFSLCDNRAVVYEAWIAPEFYSKSNSTKFSSSTESTSCTRSRKSKNKSDDFEKRKDCYWMDKDEHESSMCSTPYGYTMPRLPLGKSSKILDMISKWFWKCSPGCQQIPSIN